jgi:monoamine oxidase
MARTPLARWLQRAAADVEREETDPGAEELTRRELLVRGGAIGLALAGAGALGRYVPDARGANAPRVVVVGAGLAGLTTAYTLRQAGCSADVYEASDRIGGRCWTIRNVFADGQIGEHGGEFIDTAHREIRRLAKEVGLHLDDVNAAEAPGTEMLGWFDGKPYSFSQMSRDFKAVYPKLSDDVDAADYPTTWDSSTPRGRELDHMSVVDWIEESVPGGIKSTFGQFLDVAYNIEYGAECRDQSALNLLYLLGYSAKNDFSLYGESDERFHIRGGNDQLATRLAEEIGVGRIQLGTALVAIARNGSRFDLWFSKGGSTFKQTADKVVLTLPFSTLRSVDYAKAGFGDRKVRAIRELGMGTNSKLHVQFTSRPWTSLGANGETYSDRGYQSSWEVSRAQSGKSGILVDYTGGKIGAGFGSGTPTERARKFLDQIEPVLPGISARWNGRATVDYWTGYPWTKGSYSYWKVGQYTAFSGIEAVPQGNCHFAGEHTSTDAQGYLNGAVESGQRAAGEIVADLM